MKRLRNLDARMFPEKPLWDATQGCKLRYEKVEGKSWAWILERAFNYLCFELLGSSFLFHLFHYVSLYVYIFLVKKKKKTETMPGMLRAAYSSLGSRRIACSPPPSLTHPRAPHTVRTSGTGFFMVFLKKKSGHQPQRQKLTPKESGTNVKSRHYKIESTNLDDQTENIIFLDYEIEGVEVARVPDSVVFIPRGILNSS